MCKVNVSNKSDVHGVQTRFDSTINIVVIIIIIILLFLVDLVEQTACSVSGILLGC